MLNINEGEILLRVYNYQLLRDDGRLHIGVCERIAGKSHHKFMAYPSAYIGNPEKMYCGFGESESEALRGFLNRIKDVPIKNIEDSIYRQMSCESEK